MKTPAPPPLPQAGPPGLAPPPAPQAAARRRRLCPCGTPLCCSRAAAAVSKNPAELLLLPLLVFGAIVGLTLGVTSSAISGLAVSDTARLQSTSDAAASAFGASLSGALAPLYTIKSFLESNPSGAAHSLAQGYWASASAGLLASAPGAACLQLSPYGRVVALQPLVSPVLNLTGVLLQGGLDLFNASSVIDYRAAAVQGLVSRLPVLQGPQRVFSCTSGACGTGISPALALLGRVPIFPPAGPSGGNWADASWPGWENAPLGPFVNVTNCSAANPNLISPTTGLNLCAANATGDGTKFWGYTTAIVSWSTLLARAKISTLGDASGGSGGLRWSVARSPATVPQGAAVPLAALVNADSNTGPLPTAPYDSGVVSSVVVENTLWVITVQQPGGWTPVWRAGVYAACVVASALIAVAVFFYLLQQRYHYDLLFAMIPPRVFKEVLAHGTFSEALPHVTILFTDIVGWTTLVASMSPDKTMALLNDLFSAFDVIAAKHGVVKVETIGDACVVASRFLARRGALGAWTSLHPHSSPRSLPLCSYMAVSGTAGMPPAQQAEQMARFGLELIDAASAVTLPDGSALRIRAGMAAGPAVAGVIGRLLPHLSFFGDVVNTASRMESSSEPGYLQATAAVASLLSPAAGPPAGLALFPREALHVKGKGTMLTFFVTRAGVGPPAALLASHAADRPTPSVLTSLTSGFELSRLLAEERSQSAREGASKAAGAAAGPVVV